ncbi:hypothetical protein CVT26_007565, partial [Gymnopilus dilepis]
MQLSKSFVVFVLSAALSVSALPALNPAGDLSAREALAAREPAEEIKGPVYGHPKHHDKHHDDGHHHVKPYEARDVDYHKPEHHPVHHEPHKPIPIHHPGKPYEARDEDHRKPEHYPPPPPVHHKPHPEPIHHHPGK